MLVGGSSVFAATPQDLGIKNVGKTYQRQSKDKEKGGLEMRRQNNVVGTIGSLTSSGFTLNVINMKTKIASSVDIVTNATTTYKKDGLNSSVADLLVGQKVIVAGVLDKTANILTAKTVKIITKDVTPKLNKEVKRLNRIN